MNMTMKTNDTDLYSTTVRIDPEIVDALRRCAKLDGRSINKTIDQAIRLYIRVREQVRQQEHQQECESAQASA